MPCFQVICHSHVFFYRQVNTAEILCICKCPRSLGTPWDCKAFSQKVECRDFCTIRHREEDEWQPASSTLPQPLLQALHAMAIQWGACHRTQAYVPRWHPKVPPGVSERAGGYPRVILCPAESHGKNWLIFVITVLHGDTFIFFTKKKKKSIPLHSIQSIQSPVFTALSIKLPGLTAGWGAQPLQSLVSGHCLPCTMQSFLPNVQNPSAHMPPLACTGSSAINTPWPGKAAHYSNYVHFPPLHSPRPLHCPRTKHSEGWCTVESKPFSRRQKEKCGEQRSNKDTHFLVQSNSQLATSYFQ